MRFLVVMFASAALLNGCAHSTDFDSAELAELESLGQALVEGSPEAIGVLDLLNDPATTLVVLDDDAELNRRSARNLINHRDGWDGVVGTYDDDLFGSISEVDSVRWVGPAALGQLIEFAAAQGWIPQGEDILGTWDGVTFTADEASTTLDFVNAASHDLLDHDLGLNRRAADSIVAAQPVETVPELASLYYVGNSALTILRDEALAALGAGEGEDCFSDDDCASGLVCMGALTWGQGWCIQDWMAGTWSNDTSLPIADNDLTGVSTSVDVSGLATVPVDILVTLDIDHANPADLVVTLTDPNGDQSVLWSRESDPANPADGRVGIPGDDAVNGQWTLTVVDASGGTAGTLNGWELYLTSNWD